MRKQIKLQNQKVAYRLRRSRRARRMRLVVYCDGSIVVTTPFDLQESVAEQFMREKSHWLLSKMAFFKQFQGKAIAKYSYEDYLQYKDKAYALALHRVNHFNEVYKFHFHKINIKNQKTRWGSCSKKGNLNLNYKIALLPGHLADYIIVHELCHLKELNHSKKFWSLVAETLPDYSKLREELQQSGTHFQS